MSPSSPVPDPAGISAAANRDDFDLYQDDAARTLNLSLDANDRLLDAAAGLAEEAGEVLALIRKHVFQRRLLDPEQLRLELGDALWCLAAIATATNLSLGDVARRNLAKLRQRYPHGFDAAERSGTTPRADADPGNTG